MAEIVTSTQPSNDDFIKYRTVEQLRQAINKFRQLDLSSLDYDQMTEAIGTYFDVIPSLHMYYPPEQFNKFLFYRVRRKVNPEAEDLGLIQTFSFPLPQYCTENGRGNLKNKSVFYCSNSAWTAVRESKAEKEEIGYLSVWQGNTTRPVTAGILLPKTLHHANEWWGVAEDIHRFSQQLFEAHAKHKVQLYETMIEFLAERFVSEQKPYPFTSWVADALLSKSPGKDFIVYPSSIDQGYSSNQAMHPNFVQTCLKFIKVFRVKIKESPIPLTVGMGKVAELLGSRLTWRPSTSAEQDINSFSMTVQQVSRQ